MSDVGALVSDPASISRIDSLTRRLSPLDPAGLARACGTLSARCQPSISFRFCPGLRSCCVP